MPLAQIKFAYVYVPAVPLNNPVPVRNTILAPTYICDAFYRFYHSHSCHFIVGKRSCIGISIDISIGSITLPFSVPSVTNITIVQSYFFGKRKVHRLRSLTFPVPLDGRNFVPSCITCGIFKRFYKGILGSG